MVGVRYIFEDAVGDWYNKLLNLVGSNLNKFHIWRIEIQLGNSARDGYGASDGCGSRNVGYAGKSWSWFLGYIRMTDMCINFGQTVRKEKCFVN